MKKWVYTIIALAGSVIGSIGAITTTGLLEASVKTFKDRKKPPENESKEES